MDRSRVPCPAFSFPGDALRRAWYGSAAGLAFEDSPELELDQLLRTLSGLVLLADVDPTRSDHAAPIIATLEWCRRHGAIVVALLAEQPPCEPPWDRLLHGAFAVERQIEPALHRLLPPLELETLRGSAIEKRMREALRADGELSGLFDDEVTLSLGPLGPSPRVDLLWRVGKIVVSGAQPTSVMVRALREASAKLISAGQVAAPAEPAHAPA